MKQPTELQIKRSLFIRVLKNGIATVTFTKKDGTERVMKCTLMESVLPEVAKTDIPKTPRKFNEDALAVFDIEANGFRSFRLDSVIDFDYDPQALNVNL